MNVLLTSVSRKVSLVCAFQKALAREGGGQVWAADASARAAGLYRADRRALLPPLEAPEHLGALLTLCRNEGIKLVVPTRDEELPFYAARRGEFAAAGALLVVPPLEVVETCQDKRRFLEFCGARGFATPRTYRPEEFREARFPLFVRPARGKGGRGAMKVEDSGELAWSLARCPEAVVQEYVAAPEYTLDVCSDFSARVLSLVPRRRLQILAGESWIGMTVRRPELMDAGRRLAEALGLTGPATIQCFHEEGEPRFIEVNPRFGGGANLGFAAGALTPQFLVRLAQGKPVEPIIGRFDAGLVMLRYSEDVFLAETELPRMQGADS